VEDRYRLEQIGIIIQDTLPSDEYLSWILKKNCITIHVTNYIHV
jgi:hypothetical protein